MNWSLILSGLIWVVGIILVVVSFVRKDKPREVHNTNTLLRATAMFIIGVATAMSFYGWKNAIKSV